MSSQMFCELAALDTAELAKCGGDAEWVHRVTASVADSRICSFANDAPAGATPFVSKFLILLANLYSVYSSTSCTLPCTSIVLLCALHRRVLYVL